MVGDQPSSAALGLVPPVLQTQLIQMVVWMLQHRLLVQLHTYVCLMASPSEDEPHPREDDVPLTARVSGRSLSTPNALSFGSPSRCPLPRASVWWVGVAFGRYLGVAARIPTWALLGLTEAPSQGRACAHTPTPYVGSWALTRTATVPC